jgi:hypothetical protein
MEIATLWNRACARGRQDDFWPAKETLVLVQLCSAKPPDVANFPSGFAFFPIVSTMADILLRFALDRLAKAAIYRSNYRSAWLR